MEKNRELLNQFGHNDAIVFESPSYDEAIIGIDSNERVVYDFDKMAECLMKEDGMSYEDAIEFIEYNTIRALPYMPNSPIVMYGLDEYKDEFVTEYSFDAKKEKEGVIEWIKNWFEKNGNGCNAVLGLSGGKDSTICAALLAEALGPDRVIGVAMPDHGQGINDADKIAEYLGIKFMTMPIENITGSFYGLLGDGQTWSEQTQQNIPPRVRMTMLYAIAQTFNGRVCCCDNASENFLGYSTLFGDDAGSFAPLGELTVTEVRAIGDLLGLPAEWVHKTPDDGLPHSSSDEQKFGFTYEELDRFIRDGIGLKSTKMEKMLKMHNNSQFKRNILHVPSYKPSWL